MQDVIWNTSYQLSVWPLSWQGGLLQNTGLSQVPCGNTSLCLLADAFGRKALPAYVALWAVTSYCHYPAPHPVEKTIKTDYKWMKPCKWSCFKCMQFLSMIRANHISKYQCLLLFLPFGKFDLLAVAASQLVASHPNRAELYSRTTTVSTNCCDLEGQRLRKTRWI